MALCPHCHARNPELNQFCGSCGKTMVAPEAASGTAVEVAVGGGGATGEAGTVDLPRPQASRRRRIVRWLLAFAAGVAIVVGIGSGLPALRALIAPEEGGPVEFVPTVSEWHTERLVQPPPLNERVVTATVVQLGAHPDRYQDRLVRVDGRLAGLREDGRELALGIGEGTEVIGAVYPALRNDLSVGQAVTAIGFVSPTGTDMIVLALSQHAQEREDDLLRLAWQTLLVSGGFFLASVFVRVRGGIDRMRRRRLLPAAGVAGALVLGLVLTGCDVKTMTIVSQDGSGSVVTEIELGEEQMQEILGLPNAQASIDSWTAELEEQGVTVARGEGTMRITRAFDSCAEFNNVPHRAGESWSYLQAIPMGDGTHFVFAGLLDTASLETEQGVYDEDGRVYEEMESRSRDVVFSSSVVLPGALLGARDGTTEWRVGLGDADRLFAESVVRASTRTEALAPELIEGWRTGIDWALGVFAFGLVAYPWRTNRSKR